MCDTLCREVARNVGRNHRVASQVLPRGYMKLDKDNVLSLISNKPDAIFFDDAMPGFGVRVRGEMRTYVAQYRFDGRQRRVSLGDVRKVPLADARKAAQRHFAHAVLGQDEAARKAAERGKPTVGHVIDLYLDARQGKVRPATLREITRYLRVSWQPLHYMKVGKVERADVAVGLKRIAKESGATSADRARAALSTLFVWAMREGMAEANPVMNTNQQAPESRRDRVLTADEFAAIWRALPDNDYGRIVRLLALTGCRREEIGGLRWSEVDLAKQVITLPAARCKNKREHRVYLSDAAMAVLADCPRRAERDLLFGQSAGPFSGWSQARASLDVAVTKAEGKTLAPWRLHDVRRSVATGMAELGVLPHIVEQVLNHQSGHKGGIAGVYNHALYEREVRAALTLWSEHINEITGGGPAKVAAFPSTGRSS
jgi:integrase